MFSYVNAKLVSFVNARVVSFVNVEVYCIGSNLHKHNLACVKNYLLHFLSYDKYPVQAFGFIFIK